MVEIMEQEGTRTVDTLGMTDIEYGDVVLEPIYGKVKFAGIDNRQIPYVAFQDRDHLLAIRAIRKLKKREI